MSAVPNHQLLRNTSLETRANVAYFGTFGYELDPNRLTEEEKEEGQSTDCVYETVPSPDSVRHFFTGC